MKKPIQTQYMTERWNTRKTIWLKRSHDNFDGIRIPKPMEELLKTMEEGVQFDFLKSLEIENINKEILALHPSMHTFWGRVKCIED